MIRTYSLLGLTAAMLMASVSGSAMAQSSSESSSSWTTDFWNNDTWYLGLGAGWNRQDSFVLSRPGTGRQSVTGPTSIGGAARAEPNYSNSWVGMVSVGREFDFLVPGLRTELELAFRDSSIRRIGGYPSVGQSQAYSALINGIYDFKNDSPFTPYIGVGLGVANYQTHNVRLSYRTGPTSSGSRTSFGYQGIAGVSYDVTPQWKVGLEYRYFGISDHPTGVREAYNANTALISVRFGFGAGEREERVQQAAYVAPAPQPVAPATPNNYLVFFDFDRSDLTPEAREIIGQAATNAKGKNVVRIQVTGHTDTSGSDAYNMRLSERRARSVSTQLQSLGIPEGEIAIRATGERDLLVPTADGVREPQNRRVEIVFGNGPTS